MTKHHGMLFADRLMPLLLDGSKTQTRRPVNPQPPSYIDALHGNDLRGRAPYDLEHPESGSIVGRGFQDDDDVFYKCPWNVGDLIWCRETWTTHYCTAEEDGVQGDVPIYRADFDYDAYGLEPGDIKWKPSIHMPKWACRCWKEITDVRVQRIQEISDDDLEAECSPAHMPTCFHYPSKYPATCQQTGEPLCSCPSYSWKEIFSESWATIYPGSWEQNIWVWVIHFRRIDYAG